MRLLFVLFFITFFYLINIHQTFSQKDQGDIQFLQIETEKKNNLQGIDKILDELYSSGITDFYSIIQSNIKYPDKNKVGTTILAWQITNGEIQHAFTINSLGEPFDQEISRVLGFTMDAWVKKDTTVQFFLPIIFRPNNFEFHIDAFPSNFLSEIYVQGYGLDIKALSDNKLVKYLNKNIEGKNYELALQSLEKLLERNPMNSQLRESRIFCLFQEHRFEEACGEIAFLKNFLSQNSKYTCPLNN